LKEERVWKDDGGGKSLEHYVLNTGYKEEKKRQGKELERRVDLKCIRKGACAD